MVSAVEMKINAWTHFGGFWNAFAEYFNFDVTKGGVKSDGHFPDLSRTSSNPQILKIQPCIRSNSLVPF